MVNTTTLNTTIGSAASIVPPVSHERAIKEAIYAKLSADATLITLLGGTANIFATQPPTEAVYPCIVYTISGSNDYAPAQEKSGKILETVFREKFLVKVIIPWRAITSLKE